VLLALTHQDTAAVLSAFENPVRRWS
jgi:hypothetical protein